MEKYRRFADAATGINPFVAKVGIGSGAGVVAASSGIGTFQSSNITPNILVTAVAYLVFPLRLLVIAVLALLLFVFESLGQALRVVGLQLLVGDFLVSPIVILLSRALLYVCAALSPRRRIYPLRKSPSATVNNGADALDGVVLSPAAGDVVVSNLVSPFDFMVMQAATPLRPWLLTPEKNAMQSNTVTEGAWRVPAAIVAFVCHHREPRIVSFAPGPFQRWRVFKHILLTTTKSYLSKGEVGPSLVVDVSPLQERAKVLGVPLVVFPEGTTSNGQTMLACGPIITNTVNNNFGGVEEQKGAGSSRVHIISISYESTVAAKIIESNPKAMQGTSTFFGAGSSSSLAYLFNLSRRGSGTSVTASAASAAASMDALSSGVFSFLGLGPLFGYRNSARVTFVRPSNVPVSTMPLSAGMFHASRNPQSSLSSPYSSPLSPLSPGPQAAQAWMDEVRSKVCASVTFGNPNVLCKPVSVGIDEKRAYSAYVEQETSSQQQSKTSTLATMVDAGSRDVADAVEVTRPKGTAANRRQTKRE